MAARSYSDISDAAHSLACLAMEKLAARRIRVKQAGDEWYAGILNWAKENPEIAGSLLGLGGGAGLGALTSLAQPEEERNTLGNAISGALGGGLLGLGGGLVYRHAPAALQTLGGITDPPPETAESVMQQYAGMLPEGTNTEELMAKLKEMPFSAAQALPDEQKKLWLDLKRVAEPAEPSFWERISGMWSPEYQEPEGLSKWQDLGLSAEQHSALDAAWRDEASQLQQPALNAHGTADLAGIPYNLPTAAGMIPIDVAISQTRENMAQSHGPSVQVGARALMKDRKIKDPLELQTSLAELRSKIRGEQTSIDDLRRGGSDPLGRIFNTQAEAQAAQAKLRELRQSLRSNQALAKSTEQAMGDARRWQALAGAGESRLGRAAGESFGGKAGPAVRGLLNDIHPQGAGAAAAAEEAALMTALREASLQGRANTGGYIPTRDYLHGRVPSPTPGTTVPKKWPASPWRRMGARGLLYAGLPILAGHLDRNFFQPSPEPIAPTPATPGASQ